MRAWIIMALALASLGSARAEPRNPLDALKLESLAETRDRPLFAPSRRPPPVPVKIEAPPPPPPVVAEAPVDAGPPPFDLIGSVIGQGASYALLRDHSTSKVLRLKPGEEAQGWRVATIGARTIALQHDGRSEALALTTTLSAPDMPPPEVANVGEEDGQPPPPPAPEVVRMTAKKPREK